MWILKTLDFAGLDSKKISPLCILTYASIIIISEWFSHITLSPIQVSPIIVDYAQKLNINNDFEDVLIRTIRIGFSVGFSIKGTYWKEV